MMKKKYVVTGMTCSACSASVERNVKKVAGVNNVAVNLLSNNMVVEYDENKTNDKGIIHAVEDAGYGASLYAIHNDDEVDPISIKIKNMKRRLIVSLIFLVPLMYLSMGHMIGLPVFDFLHGVENAWLFALVQLLLTLPVIYVNRIFYINGFKTLIKRSPNMDSLIAIGSGAAVIYGLFSIVMILVGMNTNNTAMIEQYMSNLYFESAATILALITLGKYLEEKSKGKTSDAIKKLMDLAPKTALVMRNNEEVVIPLEEVKVDDIVIVKPGLSIPVDGVVIEGATTVNQAMITGESMPVDKTVGDEVIGATTNITGYIKFRATKVGQDTTLAKIVELVSNANATKAPIAKLADKISGIFVPVVIIISLVSFAVWMLITNGNFTFSLDISIAVLVISCPCALGLATPVAIMVGTGVGAQNGILIKSSETLENAHKIKIVVLDKTGTITMGKPQVTDIVTSNGISMEKILQISTAIEKMSEHPLAKAIVEKYPSKNDLKVKKYTTIPGEGVSAEICDFTYFAGNLKLIKQHIKDISDYEELNKKFASEGKTTLFFAKENEVLGAIALADEIKPSSYDAINRFKQMGIEVVMLTGDNKLTADVIKNKLNIDRVVAELLPQDKEKEIARLQKEGYVVAMIGDGINDAPALAKADVGIAIGAGTDIAIESADIVLIKSDLMDAVTAIQLSKATIKNVKENLFWAFFYNAICIPLAAGVFYSWLGWKLSPMIGAAAMSVSSIFVVTNALRLKLFKAHKMSKGGNNMIKIMKVDGMMCEHCKAHVEKALNSIDGVKAVVDLKKKEVSIVTSKVVADETLMDAVKEAGYKPTSIK